MKADIDLRPEFFKHIVLSGGTTMIMESLNGQSCNVFFCFFIYIIIVCFFF